MDWLMWLLAVAVILLLQQLWSNWLLRSENKKLKNEIKEALALKEAFAAGMAYIVAVQGGYVGVPAGVTEDSWRLSWRRNPQTGAMEYRTKVIVQ